MGLTDDLVAKFAKAVSTKNNTKNTSGTKLQGTIQFKDDKPYVKLDGSDILTPVQLTANVIENERVTVTIKDHMAIVDGNLSSPAARTADVDEVRSQLENIKDRRRSVYYQDEVPTGGTYEEGDIWFETDAGNKMHYYEDGEWVEAQFDSEAIAPQAITTEKIDAKAVRAAQIDVKDLFAQDIEASGTIMGGKFVSIPVKCWGGFTYDDLELISKYVEDPLTNPLINTAVPYLDVNGDGVVDMTDYGLIQEWLNGNTTFIPDSYFDKTSIYECFIQFTIDTTDIDKSIRLVIFRSNCGLENIEVTSMGQTGISTPQLDAERANIGELEVPLANIYSLKVATLFNDPDQPIHPILIASDLQIDENVSIEKDLYVIGKLDATEIDATEINATKGVNIPLLADNSGDTMVATPTAGAIQASSTQGITDVVTAFKSFIGSIYAKKVWYNLISVRHRNGAGDGVNYGMYIRSILTGAGDLLWDKQMGSSKGWQGERTILDSVNHSNYALSRKRIDLTDKTIDINTLTLSDGKAEIALYVEHSNAGAANISNIPVGSSPFILDVELIRFASTTDYITKQTFIATSNGHSVYVRYCTSGTWGAWTEYKLANTNGGTFANASAFTNTLKATQGIRVFDMYNLKWGTAGYVVLAKIVVTDNYLSGAGIEFTISSLGRPDGKLYIAFSNTGTVSATTVTQFKMYKTRPMYYVLTPGTNTVTVEIIAYKSTYEDYAITHIDATSHIRSRLTISYPNTFESTLRSGAIAATSYNPWTATGSATGTSTSVALTAGSSYLFTVSTTSSMEAAFMVLGKTNGAFNLVKLYAAGTLNASVSGTTLTISAGSSTSINYKYIELK